MPRSFYQQLAHAVNQTIDRKVLTAEKISSAVRRAQRIREQRGLQALGHYANDLQAELFTPREIQRIQRAPYWYSYANQMVVILVRKGIITPFEAHFLKRKI